MYRGRLEAPRFTIRSIFSELKKIHRLFNTDARTTNPFAKSSLRAKL